MIQPMPTLSISSAQHAASKTYKSSGQTEAESDFKIFVEKSTDMDDEDTNAPNAASEKELSIDELKERMSRFISNVEEGILDEMDFSF